MIRLLVTPGTLLAGSSVALEEDEAHHLTVRRVESGATAEALDGEGSRGAGTVHRKGKQWSFLVASVAQFARPAPLLLAVGGGDKDRFLWLAEKCAELGVSRLIPLETARTKHVESRLRAGTIEKGRRRAREACKQSGNPWAPVIDEITPIDQLPAIDGGTWWLADGAGAPASVLAPQQAVGWLIGPEGGFTVEDLASLQRSHAPIAVTLGAHVLRFETAALAAAVITHDRRRDA